MILVAALAQQLRYRRRALAAQAEARQLQQKIESAIKAQVCHQSSLLTACAAGIHHMASCSWAHSW